jgi:acetolactate synthase-1/2/3 large subunit
VRGRVIHEADIVVTIGRRLDFQLAYGSPAIFRGAQFIRIADIPSELRDNRRGLVEIFGDPAEVLDAIVEAAGNRPIRRDAHWLRDLRQDHERRTVQLKKAMTEAPAGVDGKMHPYRLLSAIQAQLPPNAILVIDGGDFLSFARIGLSASKVLDPGAFGCIGVGVPYGIAASLAYPDRPVIVATGDGAFGFNAIELDSAVRHKADALFIVANNGAWQIEVHDQTTRYGTTVGTHLQFSDYAAMARAFGMYAERIEEAAELPDALTRALANRPALLDVIVTPEAVSPDAKSGLAAVPDLHALTVWDEAERAWRNRATRVRSED